MMYYIRKQINNQGYQAGFELDSIVKKVDVSTLQVDFDIDNYSEQWIDSAKNGVSAFYNYYKDTLKGKLIITITKIGWFPVDTSELLISYFIIRVLCEIHQLDFSPLLDSSEFATLCDLNQLSFVFDTASLIYRLE